MTLAILPALLPDLPQIHDVYFLAFKDEPILDILYPTGIADRKAYDQGIAQYRHVDRAGYVIKCVDTSTGAVIGMAQWDVFWHPDTETEGWKRPGDIPWLKVLSQIAVHPSHQRRGAGRLLVQWGMDIADQLQVPAYAEASKSGHALYKEMGWECLRHEKIEVSNNNGDGSMKKIDIPLMVYMPKAAAEMRFEEWVRRGYPEF